MPVTKNALIRIKYLDDLLSDRHHFYDIHDLTEKVNEALKAEDYPQVGRRTIEMDLMDMQAAPFSAPIDHFPWNGKRCIAYKSCSFSIFRKKLSNEEKNLLREMLSTIGQFDGLPNFEWLDRFKIGLGLEEPRKVISFSNNPYLQNSNLLGTLFNVISNKVVIYLSYHTFSDSTIRGIEFHPYLLKQYNDRWFLIGADDSDMKILNFPLDRIDKVETLPDVKYIECPEDLSERFEDIVGVTLHEDYPVEHILCWVSDGSKGYVDTKPIHGSYTPIKGDEEQQLRNEFPQYQGGMFFTLDCIYNYELIRELCSYGKELIVLSSDGIVADKVRKWVKGLAEQYE